MQTDVKSQIITHTHNGEHSFESVSFQTVKGVTVRAMMKNYWHDRRNDRIYVRMVVE